MKKLFAFIALSAFFVSCSDDDNTPTPQPTETSFFNLSTGNKWVYKRYYQNFPTDEYEFTGRVDSVKVTGQQEIEGKNYLVLNHKIYSNRNFSQQNNEFLRVDENGHLVNTSGLVKHPGTDFQYEYTHIVTTGGGDFIEVNVGEILYKLLPLQDLSVEGINYGVYPYSGYYTPYGNVGPEGVGNVVNYKPGLGIVLEKMRYMSGPYYEDRLVHYELN